MLTIEDLGLWAGITGLILAWFSSADEGLDEPKKWARQLFLADRHSNRALRPSRWVSAFSKMFDKVFGPKHVSWQCYKTSLKVSLATTLFASIIVLFSVDSGTGFAQYFSPFTSINFWFFAIIANATADYVSLLETRYLVRLMGKTQSTLLQLFILILDLILTILIFISVLHLVMFLLSPIYDSALAYFESIKAGGEKQYEMFVLYNIVVWVTQGILTVFANAREVLEAAFDLSNYQGLLEVILPGKGFGTETNTEIFFLTTFVTSMWLWVYGFSILFLKTLASSSRAMSIVRSAVRWREKPMQSIGLIASLLYTLLFWTWVLLAK